MRKNTGYRKSKNRLQPVNMLVRPLTKKALASDQTPYAQIILEWNHIVDPAYSQVLTPIKTTYSAQKKETTLHLRSNNKSATFFLQYEQGNILESITRFFGKPLIQTIRLHVEEKNIKALPPKKPSLTLEEQKAIIQKIEGVPDEKLADSLRSLSNAIHDVF